MARKLRKSLNEDTRIIKRGKFEMETAKLYLVIALIVFHIVPLVFVFMGEVGLATLMNMFLYTINIIFLFVIGVFYGIRIGFNFKFPLVMIVISVLSYVFYYNSKILFPSEDGAIYYIMTGMITFIVYSVFSFFSVVLGGWLKRFFA